MIVATFALALFQPVIQRGVLSYATEMSIDQLLEATNKQRVANGVAPLTLNTKLSTAAQNKVEDMVTRNYWAHNTPDGQEPWVFFDAVGYKYFKAGENLAYGFSSSDATVVGWMNSPSHRENLLDSSFTEVGFGFRNGENYNNSGPETVVAAEYGRPQVLSSSSTAPTPTSPVQQTPKPATTPEPTPTTTQPTPSASQPKDSKQIVVNTDTKDTSKAASIPVSRVASIGAGKTWLVFLTGLATGLAAAILLIKHAFALRHVISNTERFFLKHPVLDAFLVAIILIGTFMLQTNGYIR